MTAIKKWAYKSGMWILTILISILVTLGAFHITKRIISWTQKTKAAQAAAPIQFDSRDTVSYSPVPQKVFDSVSDMTVNAVLSGGLGPAVVMIYADWCVHCKNMMPAFEEAASKSSVQFIRIQGNAAPVVAQKHKVMGYPTILGISDTNQVHRFNEQRTVDKLVEFSNLLITKKIPEQVVVIPEQISTQQNLQQVVVQPAETPQQLTNTVKVNVV